MSRIIREISKVDSIKGEEISLSIDLRIQQYAINLLKSHRAGSINVINIKNGEILCIYEICGLPNKNWTNKRAPGFHVSLKKNVLLVFKVSRIADKETCSWFSKFHMFGFILLNTVFH